MKENKSWGLHLAVGLVILAFAVKGYAGPLDPYGASQSSGEDLMCVPTSEYVKTYKNIVSTQIKDFGKTAWVYEAIQVFEDKFSLYAKCPEGQNASHSLFYVDGLSGQKTQMTSLGIWSDGTEIRLSFCVMAVGACTHSASSQAGSYLEAVTRCCTTTQLQSPVLRFDVSPTGVTTPRSGTSDIPNNRMANPVSAPAQVPNPLNEPARVPSWFGQPVPPAPSPLTR